jgi:hypothetical protein
VKTKRAFVIFGASLLLAPLAGVSAQVEPPRTETVPTAEEQSGTDLSKYHFPDLKPCAAPEPQNKQETRPLELDDPRAERCVYLPGITGDSEPGYADGEPILFDALRKDYNESIGAKDVVERANPYISATGRTGVFEATPSGNRLGVGAALQAAQITLYGPVDVYNWIGVGKAGDLFQIGIGFNNLSYLGTAQCSGNNNAEYRPQIEGQVQINGTFLAGICFPQYVFGIGSQTFFRTVRDQATGKVASLG